MKKDSIRNLLEVIVEAAKDTKAENILAFNLKGESTLADYVMVCHGASLRQVGAIAERIDTEVSKKLKKNPLNVEGGRESSWIVLDYGDILCHVLTEEARQFYRLEDLWFGSSQVHFHTAKPEPRKKTPTKKRKVPAKPKRAPAKKKKK